MTEWLTISLSPLCLIEFPVDLLNLDCLGVSKVIGGERRAGCLEREVLACGGDGFCRFFMQLQARSEPSFLIIISTWIESCLCIYANYSSPPSPASGVVCPCCHIWDLGCFIKNTQINPFSSIALFLSFPFLINQKLGIDSGFWGKKSYFIWIIWRIHSSLAKMCPLPPRTHMIMLIQKKRVDALLKSMICFQLLGTEQSSSLQWPCQFCPCYYVQMCQLSVGIFSVIALTT